MTAEELSREQRTIINMIEEAEAAQQDDRNDLTRVGKYAILGYEYTGVDLIGIKLAEAKLRTQQNDMRGAAEAFLAVLAACNALGADASKFKD
ncbi:hypothetical protein [Rathayibacter sp. AY1C6]|uniref:hypothetical protein n=1 Tax=Rathayibacter sp. AY1C6 TaxID=2080539 RepID=UPI0011AFE96E|nr:hypothetical protein [Rathayibacter sp. AY1C6]